MADRHVWPFVAAFLAASTLCPNVGVAAGSRHRAGAVRHHHRLASVPNGPPARLPYSTPGTVYGQSAPFFGYGPGGGSYQGYDPIGGVNHVGAGGPAANW